MSRQRDVQCLSRREAIGLVAGAAALQAFPQQNADRSAARRTSVGFPKGAVIRTLFKDVPPEALAGGPTLFHEHLNQHSSGPNTRLKFLEDVDTMTEEVRLAGKDGIRCIVDAGHEDMGRRIDQLRQIAKGNEGGVYIVGSGGYYLQRAYPPDIATKTADQIAEDLVAAAKRDHLGAYGEIGQSAEMTADEHKVFLAVAKAQVRTGLPIFTHNAYTGTRPNPNAPVARDSALRQLDVLEQGGAKPEHIAIGHVCCLDDPTAEISIGLAKRGAYVGFDRAYGEAIIPDAMRAAMAVKLIEAGYADKLLLSSDYAFENMLKKNGGPGLNLAVTVFQPLLRKLGVGDETIRGIFDDNPRRFLAFVPV